MKVPMIWLFTIMTTSVATALENTDNLQPTDKYFIAQKEAARLLENLKKISHKKRPPLETIAYFNGGTAKDEDFRFPPTEPCWADEQQFSEIQSSLLNKWRSSWKKKDVSTFQGLLKTKLLVSEFPKSIGHDGEEISEHISLHKWSKQSKGSFQDYLSGFKTIEDFDLVTMQVTAPRSYRDKRLDMVKAQLQIHLDLRGITRDGRRRHDRGPIAVDVDSTPQGWKISGIKNWGVETLIGSKPAFEEVTKSAGMDRIPQYRRLEAIRRGGYAIASHDFDNDGVSDLYVGAHGPGKLLKGFKDGSFREVPSSGLQNETLVKTAIFADFDNDSHSDLLLVRYSGQTRTQNNLRTDLILYRNNGNSTFSRKGEIHGESTRTESAMPAAVADFNGDGLLDFYIGYPGNKDFTVFGNPERKGDLKEQGVYTNNGNFKFTTKETFVDYKKETFDKITEHQRIYPHSAMALDFDQDGDVDIMVIDDRGNISPAYRNDGKGGFTQAEQHIGVMNKGFGMGMAAADVNNDGILDMALTNVNFTQKYRFDKSCGANWDDEKFLVRDHGLKFYQGVKNGQFAEASGLNGLGYAGEGLAGLEFLDYNNDGFQDLYVANGLWSGTDKDEDLGDLFVRSNHADIETVIRAHRGWRPQSEIMDILSGFKGTINGKKKESRLHLAGFQRNRLFRNNGDGSFIEVGYLEGVDSIADGYVISKADINHDGRIDLILRNGDPGTKEVSFEPVQVFKNNAPEKNYIRLKLVSKSSNKDAIGSQVVVKTKHMTQTQLHVANNGTAQSEAILHFGIGDALEAEEIRIRWPKGGVSILRNVKPGLHNIQESDTRMSSVGK